jgi:FtsP/CotA-like multicopper oxidase with cupredoxin domain
VARVDCAIRLRLLAAAEVVKVTPRARRRETPGTDPGQSDGGILPVFADAGEHELKGISDLWHLFKVVVGKSGLPVAGVQMEETPHHNDAGTGSFSRGVSGLPTAGSTATVRLADGDELDLRIAAVAHSIGDTVVRMLAYNGSIPGPTLRIRQGSEIVVNVTNDGDVEATVHWHGMWLENRFDGVPHDTQKPIPIGDRFTYRVRFPDEGLYWYHPHIREDYTQDMGLYGNIVVEPRDPEYWPPVDREVVLVVDDVLIEDGQIAPYDRSGPDQVAMGRFGNVLHLRVLRSRRPRWT